ncbi:hypothetical protein CEXT_479581 [Caerostris extrusa]|uniref:Uncharacterized protein n=1 Tax=Caerostris extrusa TaxID=172846 RepID=A0AAV4MJ64_CAEEX|nr:hypothetical protein CEXT_479581 [Caerostris extrusa]
MSSFPCSPNAVVGVNKSCLASHYEKPHNVHPKNIVHTTPCGELNKRIQSQSPFYVLFNFKKIKRKRNPSFGSLPVSFVSALHENSPAFSECGRTGIYRIRVCGGTGMQISHAKRRLGFL